MNLMINMPDNKTNLDKIRFSNNFDFLRLLGAFLVILSHSFDLTGNGTMEPLFSLTGWINSGDLGVLIFFVISGYLIPSSWLRKPNFSGFFKNRILRTVPGLFVVAVITIFIIGPLVTIIPISDYFQNPMTWLYIRIVLIYYSGMAYLPGVFVNNVFPNAVNGSLWILPVLFTMYILVAILGYFGFLKKRILLLIITVFLALTSLISQTNLYAISLLNIIYQNHYVTYLFSDNLSFTIYFMIGVLFYLFRDKIKFDLKIFILLFVLLVLSFKTNYGILMIYLAIPYILLYIAFAHIPYLNKVGKFGDFSYGLYIFAFPIQQCVEFFMPGISPSGMFLLSSLIVIPISILSYKLVESKALSLKNIQLRKTIFKAIKI